MDSVSAPVDGKFYPTPPSSHNDNNIVCGWCISESCVKYILSLCVCVCVCVCVYRAGEMCECEVAPGEDPPTCGT